MLHTKNPLTLICVQPCLPYFAWQVEVMLENFRQLGVHHHYDIHILGAYNAITDTDYTKNIGYFQKLENKYDGVASFFYYQDTRKMPVNYISGVRPNILKQHYLLNRDKIADVVFYHDCDIVFTQTPHFLHDFIEGEDWYVSDTISYIGHDYILSKGQDVLEQMCDIVGISKELVKEKQLQSGGAQYIMKGVDFDFFDKMDRDCERLFSTITNMNNEKKKENPSYHELQIFCADMWALLWGAWIKGYNTIINPMLDFCWSTDPVEKWHAKMIYHNAGITADMSNTHFYKYQFHNQFPYLHNGDTYDKSKASYKYFQLIKRIGDKSCLL
jgi:hypothetical protein